MVEEQPSVVGVGALLVRGEVVKDMLVGLVPVLDQLPFLVHGELGDGIFLPVYGQSYGSEVFFA